MTDDEDTRALLGEIRDELRRAGERQQEQLEIARAQLDRARQQVEESLALQRQALARQAQITRIAVPGILFCVAAIVYLLARWF